VPGGWELLASRPGGTVTSLVTTGSYVLAATPAGLRRSDDNGLSWTPLGGTPVELVAPSPTFDSDATLMAGTADGLLVSRSGGQHWQPALLGSRVLAIAYSPIFARDAVVLAGTEQDGVLRSDDRGQTWKSANPGLLDLAVLGLTCSPSFEIDRTVFAATASGVFRSQNAGRTWRALDALPGEPAVQSIAVSPEYATRPVILAGTESDGLLRSIDGGATWNTVAACAGRAVTSMAWSSGRLAAATDVGVMVSVDAGATWRQVGPELGPVLSVTFASDGALLAGMPHRGVARSTDCSRWEHSTSGLQANLVIALAPSADFARDRTLFAAGLEDGVIVSTDAGATWQAANGGPDSPVFALATAPGGVYAATSNGIVRRQVKADQWRQVHPLGTRAIRADGRRVVAVGVHGELLASTDGGEAWRRLVWPAAGGQPRSVALTGAHTVVGSVDALTGERAIWQSATDGQAWQRVLLERGAGVIPVAAPPTHAIDAMLFVGLDDAVARTIRGVEEVWRGERHPVWRRATLSGMVTALETSPAYARDATLLVGTSAGAWISRDAGDTFQTLDANLGDAPVVAVAFSPAYVRDRLIYAVELGGRIWRLRDATD